MQRRPDRIRHPVLPLEIVQGRDPAVARDEVARERDRRPVDLREQADGALGVAGCRDDLHAAGRPSDSLAVGKRPRDRDRRCAREAQAGRVVAVVGAADPPERLRLIEQRTFALRHPDRDPALDRAIIPAALIAMVMRVGDGHDLANADLVEHIEDRRPTRSR